MLIKFSNPGKIMETRRIQMLGLAVVVFWVGCFFWAVRHDRRMFVDAPSSEILQRTWEGTRYLFVDPDGRVRKSSRTALVSSEYHALVMLRAVWMGDKKTFDASYRWAERALSRRPITGDDLLASVWGFGRVLVPASRSRGDMDYALALLFAEAAWPGQAPSDLTPYGAKARAVLQAILDRETFRTTSGRLYLAKESVEPGKTVEQWPQELADYSPAHMRIFAETTGDPRWRSLRETGYGYFEALARGTLGSMAPGMLPDEFWVGMDDRIGLWGDLRDRLTWQGFQVVWRFGLDHFWFGEPRVKPLLKRTLAGFIGQSMRRDGKIFASYEKNGIPEPSASFSNPIVYAMAMIACRIAGDPEEELFARIVRAHVMIINDVWQYDDYQDPEQNGLSWLTDGFRSGLVRDVRKDR